MILLKQYINLINIITLIKIPTAPLPELKRNGIYREPEEIQNSQSNYERWGANISDFKLQILDYKLTLIKPAQYVNKNRHVEQQNTPEEAAPGTFNSLIFDKDPKPCGTKGASLTNGAGKPGYQCAEEWIYYHLSHPVLQSNRNGLKT